MRYTGTGQDGNANTKCNSPYVCVCVCVRACECVRGLCIHTYCIEISERYLNWARSMRV